MLFHGDNLKFLRAINSESVDRIATDPPFNKGPAVRVEWVRRVEPAKQVRRPMTFSL